MQNHWILKVLCHQKLTGTQNKLDENVILIRLACKTLFAMRGATIIQFPTAPNGVCVCVIQNERAKSAETR